MEGENQNLKSLINRQETEYNDTIEKSKFYENMVSTMITLRKASSMRIW